MGEERNRITPNAGRSTELKHGKEAPGVKEEPERGDNRTGAKEEYET